MISLRHKVLVAGCLVVGLQAMAAPKFCSSLFSLLMPKVKPKVEVNFDFNKPAVKPYNPYFILQLNQVRQAVFITKAKMQKSKTNREYNGLLNNLMNLNNTAIEMFTDLVAEKDLYVTPSQKKIYAKRKAHVTGIFMDQGMVPKQINAFLKDRLIFLKVLKKQPAEVSGPIGFHSPVAEIENTNPKFPKRIGFNRETMLSKPYGGSGKHKPKQAYDGDRITFGFAMPKADLTDAKAERLNNIGFLQYDTPMDVGHRNRLVVSRKYGAFLILSTQPPIGF